MIRISQIAGYSSSFVYAKDDSGYHNPYEHIHLGHTDTMKNQNPKDRWKKRIKKRITFLITIGVITFAMAIAFPIFLWSISQDIASEGLSTGFWDHLILSNMVSLIFPVILFVNSIFLGLQVYRTIKIYRRVPLFDGHVCPKCRQPLSREFDRGDCAACGQPYTTESLLEFWNQFAFAPTSMHLTGWWNLRKGNRLRGKVVNSMRTSWRFQLLYFISVLIVLMIVYGFILSMTPLTFLMQYGAFFFFMYLGMIFMIRGGIFRQGESLHCSKCDYEHAPGGGVSNQCPECGAAWKELGGTVRGPRRRKPIMIVMGIACWLLSFFFLVGGMRGNQWKGYVYRLYSTDLLITEMIAGPYSFSISDYWVELGNRTLTADQEEQLAFGLLDRLLDGQHLGQHEITWLEKGIKSGSLSSKVRDRFYKQVWDIAIQGPQTTQIGEITRFTIQTQLVIPSQNLMFLYIDEFIVKENGKTTGQKKYPTARLVNDSRFTLNWMPSKPGSATIHLSGWLVSIPGQFMNQPIVWKSDDSPQIPQAATWSGFIELERTIEVKK